METPSIFPEIDVLPSGLRKVGRFIKHCVSFCPLDAPDYMSNHYEHPLDTPIEPVTSLPGQPEWDDHFDDMGCYTEREV